MFKLNMADFMQAWEDILELHSSQDIVDVKILKHVNGGMIVDLLGIEAFLPGSQMDIQPVKDFESWLGKTIGVKVIKINQTNKNAVVSHKILLKEVLAEKRKTIMSKLHAGLVLEGQVKAISDFGVFIDLGGNVNGLVRITDISWGRVQNPAEVVTIGETVRVIMLAYNSEKKRISLGMKQLTPHPWDQIGDKYVEGTKVEGKVVSLTDYGIFVEIEKGIEGLVHTCEISWSQPVPKPSKIVQLGQIMSAIVLSIDKNERKLALSIKQLTLDPWEGLIERLPIYSIHKGIAKDITNFGVFVEIEPAVHGLVHISDLSWSKKIKHPSEILKKGDSLDVVVLSVDTKQKRIALGHKQIKENPWDKFEQIYPIGTETEAKIEKILDKKEVIVELPGNVDGLVPISQLSFSPVINIKDYFDIGDILPVKVVEFDKEARRIVLSAVEYLRDKEQAIIDRYNEQHPVPNANKYSINSELPIYTPSDKEID